jgi:hypothetical protein
MRIRVAVPDDTPEGQDPKVTIEELSALASEAIGGPVELFDPVWVTVVRFGKHLAPTFRNGRAFLAGGAFNRATVRPGHDYGCPGCIRSWMEAHRPRRDESFEGHYRDHETSHPVKPKASSLQQGSLSRCSMACLGMRSAHSMT